MSNNSTEQQQQQQQHNAYTAPVASIDISTGVTEGNPALDNSKTTNNNNNNSTINENEETMSQFSLICVVFCEALVSSCAFTAFPDKPSTTRWLVFASFYFGQLVSTPLVARFSHLFSRRLLVITGLAGLFAGQAFYALANSLPLWAAARAISGFFAGTAAFARASLSTPHDWKRLLVCAGLVSSSGSVIGISFCMCLQTLLVGNENTDTQPFYTFLADFPQAPIGFLTGFFVLIALVFAVLFTRNSTAEEEEEEHKQESTATTAVKPVRLAVVGGFVFVAALFARVYSGTLFSAWIVSEDGLGFDSNDGGILCIQFMIASAVIHAAMLFFCTNSIK